MTIRMLADNVLIYPLSHKVESAAGLMIFSIDKTAPKEGVVVLVGPGKLDEEGNLVPVPFARGDKVVYAIGDLNEIKQDDDVLHVIPSTEILCKIVP